MLLLLSLPVLLRGQAAVLVSYLFDVSPIPYCPIIRMSPAPAHNS